MSERTNHRGSDGTCLCIIFNHPYLANLPLLRRIYAGRFRHVRFLVPLARVEDEDVITVYRGSFSHNAYAVDAWPELRGIDCGHFLFVHDDVLLAPALHEGNLLEVLGVGEGKEGFIPMIQRVPKSVRTWGHFAGPLWRLTQPRNFLSGTGVDSLHTVLAQLPPAEAAMAKLAPYGAERETVVELRAPGDPHDHLRNFTYFGERTAEQDDGFREHYLRMLFDASDGEGRLTIPYPLVVSGPSGDFYLVPREAMADYVHLSGVLAAAGVFVEVAAPTALALACDRVRTQADTPVHFDWSTAWRQPETVAADMRADATLLGVHPVKLSMVRDLEAFVSELRDMQDLPVGVDAALLDMERDFDAQAYLEANPDVRAAGVSAWAHYLHHGRAEGRALRAVGAP